MSFSLLEVEKFRKKIVSIIRVEMEAAGFYETLITIAYKNTMRSKWFYTKELNIG